MQVYSTIFKNPKSPQESEILDAYKDTKGPLPPWHELNYSKCYWLVYRDFDGRYDSPEPYQWQPNAKQWCHVGQYAKGKDLDLTGYIVIQECELPSLPQRIDICDDRTVVYR